jgi:WD40 repeat protein
MSHRILAGSGLLLLNLLLATSRQYLRKMEGMVNFLFCSSQLSLCWGHSYFFSLAGSSVKVYSVATGSAVSTLSLPEGNGAISLLTCAILNPHNALQLVTGSLDGRLMVWDFLDATLLKVIDIAQPIHHICAHADYKDCIFVAATRSSRKTKMNSTGTSKLIVILNSLRDFGDRYERRCPSCIPQNCRQHNKVGRNTAHREDSSSNWPHFLAKWCMAHRYCGK